MNEHLSQRTACSARLRRAFTLVELMVAVAILTAIVLVLYRIFDQTQRAMRSNATQVDVMEGGRATMEMLARDLEQMQVLNPQSTNVNCVILFAPLESRRLLDLPGSNVFRLHQLDEIYFVAPFRQSATNRQWIATTYRVLSRSNATPDNLANPRYVTNHAPEGVGWLAKASGVYTLTNGVRYDPFYVLSATNLAAYQRVADGIVHFRVRPLDSAGYPLQRIDTTNLYGANLVRFPPFGPATDLEERSYWFLGEKLPAFLEIEVGILEPDAVDRMRALPARRQAQFLSEQAARVHYFQQRIPIRNASKILPGL